MSDDHLVSMYDAIKNRNEYKNNEQRENYFTEIISFAWDHSKKFKSIFLKFLDPKIKSEIEKYKLFTQENFKAKDNLKTRNKPDIIIEKEGKLVFVIENKIDSQDYKNFRDYLKDKNFNKATKILIISKIDKKLLNEKINNNIKKDNIKFWENLYEKLKDEDFVFSNEIKNCMETFGIHNPFFEYNDTEIKTYIKYFLEIKDFFKNISTMNVLRLNDILNSYQIYFSIKNKNKKYNLYFALEIIEEYKNDVIYFRINFEKAEKKFYNKIYKEFKNDEYKEIFYHESNNKNYNLYFYFPLDINNKEDIKKEKFKQLIEDFFSNKIILEELKEEIKEKIIKFNKFINEKEFEYNKKEIKLLELFGFFYNLNKKIEFKNSKRNGGGKKRFKTELEKSLKDIRKNKEEKNKKRYEKLIKNIKNLTIK
jgi:hypothetical protein